MKVNDTYLPHLGEGAKREPPNRFTVTLFNNVYAKTKSEREVTLPELGELIRGTKASAKERLPLLKLTTFGDERNDKGCLRHDGNVKLVYGIEGDYDGELMPFEEAVARVRAAGVAAILYTSPNHKPDRPRWRALLPFAGTMLPISRSTMMNRANTIFDGTLAGESWTLSQSYYFGRVNDHFQLEVIDGAPIDTKRDLLLAPVPPDLLPRPSGPSSTLVGSAAVTTELSEYGEAALRSAARKIINAPDGKQRATLNAESYSIGRLAGAGGVPVALALDFLIDAGKAMRSYDPSRPWRPNEVEAKVRRGFAEGMARPRPSLADLMAELDRQLAEAE
jgi:hypothetical protein